MPIFGSAILVEEVGVRQPLRVATALTDSALLADLHPRRQATRDNPNGHFHRAMVTRVPTPTVDWRSNSLTSRRAPESPSPSPVPELQPSVSACAISLIPGPWSSKTNRTPRPDSVDQRFPPELSATSVNEGVAGKLAGGGHELGLIHQRKALLLRQAAHRLPPHHDVMLVPEGQCPVRGYGSHSLCEYASQQLHTALHVQRGVDARKR